MSWNVSFITPSQEICCPKLWRDFSADSGILSASLEITGLGLYRAFLNGERVGDDYLTPGFNDYDAYLRKQTYDVTALMRRENRLCVFLGKGWYMGRIGFNEKPDEVWGNQYLLSARLTWIGTDGVVHTLETDDNWLASSSMIRDGNIYDGEFRDDMVLDGEPVPCRIADVNYQVEDWISPPIRVREERKPKLIDNPAHQIVLDFGQNYAGTFRFVNRFPRGAKLLIQTGEVLQDGNFYRDNLRGAKSEFIYISDGREKIVEPFFTYYGYRYIRVSGVPEIDPADFTGLVLCSDLKETLSVRMQHPGIDRLMQNTLWGQRSNFMDVPTDCPQRDERMGWTADSQVFVNTACYQMNCKDFYRKYMQDMRVDQTRYLHGNIAKYSPCLKAMGRHSREPGGAVWADAGTIIPWNVYMNYGDIALLAENYPMMRDYTEVLIADDLRLGGAHVTFDSFTHGDWLALDGEPGSNYGGTDNRFIQGIYYLYSTELTGKAAAVLGKKEDAARYQTLSEEIRAAMKQAWLTPEGELTVPTQTAYVLALLHGIYRDCRQMEEAFRNRLRLDHGKLLAGFTGAPLMLPVMFDHHLEKEAFDILFNEDFPGWLYCVNLGATTIWERWNALDAQGKITDISMNSLNHYAYGSVC